MPGVDAACSLLLAGLSRVAEISAPAHSISKRPSPNAHTQRWLQGVDKVSVRAEVEDELELVCGRLALRSVREQTQAHRQSLGRWPHQDYLERLHRTQVLPVSLTDQLADLYRRVPLNLTA